METVLLHKSAFLYVTSIFRLSSFVFANALLTGITKTFVPFYSSFPEIFNIFATYIQIIIRIMKNLVEKINAEYEVFVSNANAQVEKGNKAAGTRARKAALELSKLMKEFRKVSVEASK